MEDSHNQSYRWLVSGDVLKDNPFLIKLWLSIIRIQSHFDTFPEVRKLYLFLLASLEGIAQILNFVFLFVAATIVIFNSCTPCPRQYDCILCL